MFGCLLVCLLLHLLSLAQAIARVRAKLERNGSLARRGVLHPDDQAMAVMQGTKLQIPACSGSDHIRPDTIQATNHVLVVLCTNVFMPCWTPGPAMPDSNFQVLLDETCVEFLSRSPSRNQTILVEQKHSARTCVGVGVTLVLCMMLQANDISIEEAD